MSLEHAQELRTAGFYWGSGVVLPVPSGGSVGMEQAAPNTLAREAMLDKVTLCITLGASFVTPGTGNKTATQVEGEREVQHSVLSLIVSNLTEGYRRALGFAYRFMDSGRAEQIELEFNKQFIKPNATSQDLIAMVGSWQQGAIPFGDFVQWAQTHGFIDPEKTMDEVAEEVASNTVAPSL